MTSITDQTETATPAAETKPNKKARGGARRAHVAPAKAKTGKKASPAKKAPKTAPKPKVAHLGKAAKQKRVREGSKTETIFDLLKRSGGATLKEIMKATGWQAHSVRGFISSALRKKMGLKVESAKGDDGDRTYSIKA